jgi:hypothetical protein
VLAPLLSAGCDPLRRPGDTTGEQRAARWEWSGRLAAEPDSALTLVRLRIDTAGAVGRHDVLLARFDFDPSPAVGDEYALTVGLDLGVARDLPLDRPLPLGPPPARIPALGTVTRLGTPLRPDSVRGTVLLSRRGLRQLTGRIDATLYFTAWGDTARHASYPLHQKIFGVK